MAFTTDFEGVGSDSRHKINFQVKGGNSEKFLPDLPQDDYLRDYGDLWKLSLKSFFGFHQCVTRNDIRGIFIIAGNADTWNIDCIVTFAVYNRYYWAQTSANLESYTDIGFGFFQETRYQLTLRNPPPPDTCIGSLFVMAQTSGRDSAGADSQHRIEMQAKGLTATTYLPDLFNKNDYYPLKGDLWKLEIEDYFGVLGCVTKNDITGIAILAGSNDGWNIDSIVTYAHYTGQEFQLTSVDLDVYRWVDGDSTQEAKRFPLTLAK